MLSINAFLAFCIWTCGELITMLDSNYINKALTQTGLLSPEEFVATTNYPVDKLYIDKFWSALSDSRLIYVDDWLLQWMGFDKIKSRTRMASFKQSLTPSTPDIVYFYEYDNIQYTKFRQEVIAGGCDPKHYPPIKSDAKSTQRHLLLTANCLRDVLMRINTSRGAEVRNYYFGIENLFKAYISYMTKYREIQYEEQRQQLTRYEAHCNELLEYKLFRDKNDTLYVVSTNEYAREGYFKVGKTKSIMGRIATMNTSHIRKDEVCLLKEIKCSDAGQLESRVRHVLKYFRDDDSREFYRIPFLMLSHAIDQLNSEMSGDEELANSYMRAFAQLQLSASAPAEIPWAEGTPFRLTLPKCDLGLPGRIGALCAAAESSVWAKTPQIDVGAALPTSGTTHKSECVKKALIAATVVPPYIKSLCWTRERAEEIVAKVFKKLSEQNPRLDKIAMREINELVKAEIVPKSKFAPGEWKEVITAAAETYNIELCRKTKK